jgi:hypothetical protein
VGVEGQIDTVGTEGVTRCQTTSEIDTGRWKGSPICGFRIATGVSREGNEALPVQELRVAPQPG